MEVIPKKFIYINENALNQQNSGYSGVGTRPLDNIWYRYVHSSGGKDSQMNHILQMLKKYGTDTRYGDFLNKMQENHRLIYREAEKSGNWRNKAYKSLSTQEYQKAYKGNSLYNFNNPIENSDLFDYNTKGIANAYNSGIFIKPGYRTSGDNPNKGYNVDGLYSSITDLRRLLGREGDWDENSQEFKNWLSALNKLGWETYKNDGYYFLRRLNNDEDVRLDDLLNRLDIRPINPATPQQINPYTSTKPNLNLTSKIDASRMGDKEQPEPKNNWLNYIRGRLPEVLEAARLTGNLSNNQKVYDATKRGVKGNYLNSYHTYTQLLGDEATKLGFYRRATQGETLAARPFTSDADRYMAYRMEAKRIGDESRAQGDLPDNQEIRRTSEKSEEYTNANRARDNQAENANIAERNKVASTLARLEAEKYAADWTDIDNYLMGTETRWRLKIEEYKNSLKAKRNILYQLALENDKRILNKTDEFNKRYEQVNGNPNDPELQRLSRELRNIKAQITMEYMDPVEYIKNGSKITYTKKDDLLYKTIRDSVEHFRKMTKMADDSAAKHRTKVKDLILPPKSKTRKMLLGGIAPFTVFKPVVLGGSTTMLTSSTGNISGSDKESGSKKDEQLEFVKKLFQDIALLGKGIPIDVSLLATDIQKTLNRASMLGTLLTSDLLQSLYVASMNKVSLLPFSLNILKNAEEQAKANGALGEYAVTSNGNYVAMDTEGHLHEVSLEQLMSKGNRLNPLTNNLLIYLRNITPEMALQKGDNYMLTVVANGIGVNKINDNIREYISGVGVDEIVRQGYTRLQAGEIKKGLEGLMEAPDGDYKVTLTIKTSERQGEMAIDFIVNSLQDNELAVLKLHAAKRGISVENYIGKLVRSKLSTTSNLEFDAVTGKAAKDGKSSESDKGDANNSAGLAFVLGHGPRVPVVFNTGTSYLITANGILGVLQNKSNENLGLGATLLDASKSLEGGYFLWNKATFGGSKLIPTAFNHIILNDSTVIGVDLPYKKGIDGNEIPDFLQLKRMEEADQEIRQKGILSNDYNAINLIYLNHLLSPKYNLNGKLNKQDYKRFAVILATLDENSLLNKNAILSDEVAIASEVERDLYNESMRKITGNNKFELDEGWPIFGGGTKLYKGSIFVPYLEDIAFAALSSGKPLNVDLQNNSSTVQLMQYAPATLTYKPLNVTLSLIKNN